MSAPDYIPDWVTDGTVAPVADELWPADVLTDDEWEAGWFDRQVTQGNKREWERAITPRWLGGTAPDPEPPFRSGATA